MKKPLLATAAVGAGLLLAVAVPLSASAHVSVTPNTAEAGSYALITVKVPNESEDAGTNKLELDLPTDTPFVSVSYVPVAGWTAELVREKLPAPVKVGESEITEAVTKIVYTADKGNEIVAGQLQTFGVSLGPVPDTGSVQLAAIQTYTDGSVVKWNESGDDAEHPAPVLYINDQPATDHHGGDDDATEEPETDTAAGATPTAGGSDTLARVLGIGGLVVGAVGIVLAITSRRRVAE